MGQRIPSVHESCSEQLLVSSEDAGTSDVRRQPSVSYTVEQVDVCFEPPQRAGGRFKLLTAMAAAAAFETFKD